MTVEGDELTVDLSGCSPQVMGPSNATLSSTCSTVFYALIASADVPIAANAGCYRPVKIVAPPGLCVSAAVPAPVVHRIAIGHRLATVLFGALHQAVPERMPAAYYAVSYVVTLQTIDPELGRRVLVEIEVGGIGALPVSDGASALSFGMHNNANIPMEMIESDMPVTFLGYGLLTDTGGPGRWRGGLGLWREWRIDCAMAQLSTNLDRFQVPSIRSRRRRARGAKRALLDPRRSKAGVALQSHEHDVEKRGHRSARNFRRRRLRRSPIAGAGACRA